MLKQTSKLCSSPSSCITCLTLQSFCTTWRRGANCGICPNRDSNHSIAMQIGMTKECTWSAVTDRDIQSNICKEPQGKLQSLNLAHTKKLLKNYMLKQTTKQCIPGSASPLPLSPAQHSSSPENVRKGVRNVENVPTQNLTTFCDAKLYDEVGAEVADRATCVEKLKGSWSPSLQTPWKETTQELHAETDLQTSLHASINQLIVFETEIQMICIY